VAQVFLAERPGPEFTIGPLFLRATVAPDLGPVVVEVLWGLVIPSERSATDLAQDLYLLWPGEVASDAPGAAPDPALKRFVETRGFTAIDEGRLPLSAQRLFQVDGEAVAEPIGAGAPYVTFVRQGGALGLTAAVSYIRIPWTPQLANRTRLLNLRFTGRGLVRERRASWVENTFWGPRHTISLSWSDVRARGLFPLYIEQRDRLVRLADDPSQILLNFRRADELKIDGVSPPAASRKLSETMESTEVVSLFLEQSGLTPQVLTVQFGYFSGLRSWAPVLIPVLFFVLGNVAAVLVRNVAERLTRLMTGRFLIGRRSEERPAREHGVILGPETLARIVPGRTTHAEVGALCGENAEERRQLDVPDRRTLIYRGRRVVPHRRRIFGWLAAVSRWDVEHHEVEIELEHDVVRDVHARVRRERLAAPSPATR
jgi:hypothetical protein